MAGAGYKLFNTGDVLTAAQVNTYLQEQTVMVFASSAARTSALSGVLAEGMVSYLQDTNAVEVYNGSAWVGVSGAGDVTEVQAGTGISVASGTGPIPVVTNTMATAINAAGDLIYGTGNDAFTRLALGTAGQVLKVNSGATAPEWGAASAPGFVGAQLTKSAQSVATGDYYAVTWDTEAFDTDAFHSTTTNNSRVTIPTGKGGYYRFSGIITFATNSTGSRLVRVHKNGANIVWVGWLAGLAGGNETGVVFCHTLNAAAGDYFELFVKQESGGNLNVTASASWDVQYLGA